MLGDRRGDLDESTPSGLVYLVLHVDHPARAQIAVVGHLDDELAALLSPRVRAAITARGAVLGRWVDFERTAASAR